LYNREKLSMQRIIQDPGVHLVICPSCGELYSATRRACPYCTLPVKGGPAPHTRHLNRMPSYRPTARSGQDFFPGDAQVWLQFLPSGICATLALEKPVVLGRQALPGHLDQCDLLDLTDLGGLEHGVSRTHCLLRRHDAHLVVTDLGSTNGTRVNDQSVPPHQEHVIAHGDKLILGTLHLVIFFGQSDA
jgi:hypothetical protein